MANFNEEFEKLILKEGGYVNDPDDRGGETYLGISRRYNPKWYGWTIIDKHKKTTPIKDLNKVLKKDKSLIGNAKVFYKEKYWDTIGLDEVHSQSIANQLFDTAVNMGVYKAITLAQKLVGMTITGKYSEALIYNLNKYE